MYYETYETERLKRLLFLTQEGTSVFFDYQGSTVQWLRLVPPGLALVRFFSSCGSFDQLVFIESLKPVTAPTPTED